MPKLMRLIVVLVSLVVAACGGGGGGGGGNNTTTPPPAAVTLTSLAPAGVNAGASATVLTATGSGFTTASVIEWNGTPLTTSYVSATSVTATIPATDLTAPGSVPVTVSNTGGASSQAVDFAISEQTAPTVATLSPASQVAGGQSFVLTVTGTNFLSGATVLWNGTALPTTFQSATVLTALVSAAQIATVGMDSVSVANDAASGGTSNAATLVVSPLPPAPTLTSISPTSLRWNEGDVILTLIGTGFTPTTQVFIGQNGSFATGYVSSTELTVAFSTNNLTAGPGAALNVYVTDPMSYYQNSNALQLTLLTPVPAVTGMSPSTVYANQGALTLAITGQYFTATSVAYVNGVARPTTVNANNYQMTVQLTALDVATAGTAVITVEDPASGNIASNSTNLTIQPLPALGLSSVSPSSVPVGYGAFTLTVSGAGFAADSVIQWNGTPLTTTLLSVSTLTAPISASQVASLGTAQVTVVNPANEGGTSTAQTVNIVAPSVDAVSYQIDNGHSGAITFKTLVPTLPTSPAWSVNVGGAPSYALIVANRVFVVAASNGNSQLLALDAATGATLWGPSAYAGSASITYDNGVLFVTTGSFLASGVLTAVDAVTGNIKWNEPIPGFFGPTWPAVASEGIVYALANGDLTAFNETNGATLWHGSANGGGYGSAAVSLDGVYTAAPCNATDFQPITGATLWTSNTGCEGGGGNTPVVAAGRVYAPIAASGYGGSIYNAESGLVLGSFGYSAPPAVTATQAYTLYNSILESVTLTNNQVNWTFTGDGSLNTSPVVVNNYVFVGSSTGNLYGLNATTGNQLWIQNLGAAIPTAITGPGGIPSGLAAGDGLLVVPAGNTVTAFVLSTNP